MSVLPALTCKSRLARAVVVVDAIVTHFRSGGIARLMKLTFINIVFTICTIITWHTDTQIATPETEQHQVQH